MSVCHLLLHRSGLYNGPTADLNYRQAPIKGGYKLGSRGFHSHCQTDGDDGDGQGGRFWADPPEAPFSAPQAEKILSHRSHFLMIFIDF